MEEMKTCTMCEHSHKEDGTCDCGCQHHEKMVCLKCGHGHKESGVCDCGCQ